MRSSHSLPKPVMRPDPSGTHPRRQSRYRLGALLALLLLAVGMAMLWLPFKTLLAESQALKLRLDGFGLAAPAVFVAATALLTVLGAPRLLLCSLAGMAFGGAWGLLWSQLGTLLGAYGTFLLVRVSGREAVLQRYPQFDRYSHRLRKQGILAVLLLRQLPMNAFFNNLLLGLSPVGHRDFLVGSLLGYLPLGLTAVLIGAGLVQADLTRLIQYLAAGLAAFVLLGFLLKHLLGPARNPEDDLLSVNNGLD